MAVRHAALRAQALTAITPSIAFAVDMEPGISRISEGILSAYYPIVQSIHDYVSCVIGQDTDNTKRDILMHETDTLKYRRFLRETVVATFKDHRSNKLVIAPPVGHLREVHHRIYRSTCPILTSYQVVEQGQITLLRSKSSTKNILTAGYRLVSVLRLLQMHETVLRP